MQMLFQLAVLSCLAIQSRVTYGYKVKKEYRSWLYNGPPGGPPSPRHPAPIELPTSGPPLPPGTQDNLHSTVEPMPPNWLDEDLLTFPEPYDEELAELKQEGDHAVSDPRGPIKYQGQPIIDLLDNSK